MKKLFLDIETIPAEDSQRELIRDIYNRKIENGNKTLGTFEEYLATTGLDATFGRICCIGYALDDNPSHSLFGDEKDILIKFWQIAKDVNLFVGFNLLDFDLKFIYQRSVVHQVKPSQDLNFAKFRNFPIYDVMYEWTKWSNLNRVSLHALSKALGFPSSKEGDIEGKDVAKAFAAGRIKEICDYCQKDVDLTRQIYSRLTFA